MIQTVGEFLFMLIVVFVLSYWTVEIGEMIWHIVAEIWHLIKYLSKIYF
nr:MAG TPA: hypothetical protein [Caudoviricetes sp.]